MSLLVIIHTCKKYENSRTNIIKNTWFKNYNDVLFLIDYEKHNKDYIFLGKYETGYTYHPETIKKIISYFYNNIEKYKWFMIIDDDSYLFKDRLEKFLEWYDYNENYFFGDFLNWCETSQKHQENKKLNNFSKKINYNIDVFTYPYWNAGGPGMVFSKNLIKELYEYLKTSNINNYLNHDVWINSLFSKSNIFVKKIHIHGFYQYFKNVKDLYKDNIISIHFNGNMKELELYHKSIY